MRVKASLPFLQGVPARYTKLHTAYPGWLVGKTQVFIVVHMTIYYQNEFENGTNTSCLCKHTSKMVQLLHSVTLNMFSGKASNSQFRIHNSEELPFFFLN